MANRKRKDTDRDDKSDAERESLITPEAIEALRGELDRTINRMTGYLRGMAEPWFSGEQKQAESSESGKSQRFAPLADLDEDDDGYELTIELPGMTREQVDIESRNGALVISGEKRSAHEDSQPAGSWRERRYGAFRRIVPLPDDVEEKRIKASFEDGVLYITLPKIADSRSKRRRIKIDPA